MVSLAGPPGFGMSRSERLLALLQALRRRRRPVSGGVLAEELGISLRTLYRDIASLKAQGASIEGEPGFGYVLRPGYMLPPLMFSADEIEALALGSRWVAEQADKRLALAARDALAKIGSVLPPGLRDDLETSALLVGPGARGKVGNVDLGIIRQAIRVEHKLGLLYRDGGDAVTERVVWPFALGFFESIRVVAAWCELRQGFRHFRTDRIMRASATGARYPRRRHALLKEWRAIEGIPLPP
jgi:predicted DNA-binding transcriptional regulator YafY